MFHIVASAFEQYTWAIQRNFNAMVHERRRLQRQIDKLRQEIVDNEQRIAGHHRSSPEERRDALMQVVLQRVRLDEDSAELEKKGK